MKINNTVSTTSVNTASKAISSKASSASKSSTKATSNKTTGTAKSRTQAKSSKTASATKSSTKAKSSKTVSSAKNSAQASNGKIANVTKTGIQASSNKSLGDSKTNTKASIGSTIASITTSAVKSIASSSSKENSNFTSAISGSISSSVTKYIVDAPAIYTSQALKMTIGKATSSLGAQLRKGYVPGMPSDIYKKVKNATKPKFNGKTPTINKMLSNLDKDKTLAANPNKKKAMLYAGEKMLNDGYDAKFVAGVLANIMHEGEPGQFESSNYSTHPEKKPNYLGYMENDFAYAEKYSGKNIGEVGIKETVKLQKEASKIIHIENRKGEKIEVVDKFGLGMFQFTGTRTSDVLDEYQAFYNKTKENHPTKEQCMEIEINFALKELKSKNYKNIYESWKEGDKIAYSAGNKFCKEYEKPKDKESQAITRGNDAEEIYTVMKRK